MPHEVVLYIVSYIILVNDDHNAVQSIFKDHIDWVSLYECFNFRC